MEGGWLQVGQAMMTAIAGVFLLSAGVQGWFLGATALWFMRIALCVAALFMIEGGWLTDVIGVGIAVVAYALQRGVNVRAASGP